MLVDEIKIKAKAGKGGDGVVRWRHEKFKEFSGPSGGNGGKGGDVYLRAVRDLNILNKYKHKREIEAQGGEDGKKNSQHGKDGENAYLDVPIGSIVEIEEKGKKISLIEEGQEVLVLKGGAGGLGNESFKSSTNTTPKEWTPGKDGEEASLYIELELIADLGFIGLPNAGKSSLLNALTGASSKVGEYSFTTLEPHLGEMHGFILADIPGIIGGASEGKGLGLKFLKHIKRTKVLAHLLPLDSEDILRDYKSIREEISKYGEGLDEKEEIIILSKADESDNESIKRFKNAFKDRKVFVVSILDNDMIKQLKDDLIKILREK